MDYRPLYSYAASHMKQPIAHVSGGGGGRGNQLDRVSARSGKLLPDRSPYCTGRIFTHDMHSFCFDRVFALSHRFS